MPMNWWARVAIGAVLGLAATLGCAFLLEGWIVPAAAGGVLGALAFLATFFVWSADVPPTPENPAGYEQVLLDKPNSLASLTMIAALVALAFFVRFDGGAEGGADAAAYLAERDALATDLASMYDAYAKQIADYDAGVLAQGDFQAALAEGREVTRALAADARALEAPEAHAEDLASLRVAAEQLSASMESMDLCLGGMPARCDTAASRLADYEAAFERLL